MATAAEKISAQPDTPVKIEIKESAPAGKSGGEKKKGCCTCKRCVFGCCCCCCIILVPLAVLAAVVAAAYEGAPVVEVKMVTITDLEVGNDRVTLTLTPEIYLKNPNRSPLEAEVEALTADAWSLDREAADKAGQALYLGNGSPPAKVEMKPESETTFKVIIESDIVAPDSVPLAARLNRDCGLLSQKKTKLRIKLRDVKASAMGVKLPELGDLPEIDIEIGCPQMR